MEGDAVQVVEALYDVIGPDDVVSSLADVKAAERVRDTLSRVAEPDFEVHMRAPEHGTTELRGRGLNGFRSVWEEWTEPFEFFRIEVERRLDRGGQVVDLVKLTARTRTGGVVMEQDGAAVWTVREGKLARAEFYLQRDEALKAAGIEPGRPAGE
jgi:ketosteroid isomerase-like protein